MAYMGFFAQGIVTGIEGVGLLEDEGQGAILKGGSPDVDVREVVQDLSDKAFKALVDRLVSGDEAINKVHSQYPTVRWAAQVILSGYDRTLQIPLRVSR